MGSRTLLCVEPDERAVAQIRQALSPFGIAVESIPNGETAVEWARANEPAMIVVSVEPRKVGYAVCNKLKRSSDLQHIPLILTSSEETPQTFEQHKKLKSRADEYLLKPFGDEDLLNKVGGLIDLRAVPAHGRGNGAGPEHAMLGADVSEELAVGDSDIVHEEGHEVGADQRPRSGLFGSRGGLDPSFEQETDAAFAALQSPAENTAPLHISREQAAVSMWEEEKTRSSNILDASELPEVEVEETGGPFMSLFRNNPDAAPPPDPEEVAVTPDPVAPLPPMLDGRGEVSARIASLESERRSLQDQVQALRRQVESSPGQPLSKDREYLSLREIINRKEKDLLDLRDALDAKDRQILDQKDRFREHERARRDLEEKMLEVERNLVAVEERATALAHDKEKAIERERALKGRLDEQQLELAKAHQENEDLDKKLLSLEENRGDLDRTRSQLEARIGELEERHQGELARLRDERTQSESELKAERERAEAVARGERERVEAELRAERERVEAELRADRDRLQAELKAELEGFQKRSAEELNALSDQLLGELDRTRKDREQALETARAENEEKLERERQANAEALQNKDKAHAAELESARHRLEEERAEGDQRRQREMAEADAKRLADLEAAEHRRLEEIKQQKEDYEAKLSALERLHLHEKSETAEQHRQDLEQAGGRASRAEGDLQSRNVELADTRTRQQALEAERDRLAADLAERESKLAQLRDKTADLEAKSAEYEDQILRAYQKLRSDDKLIERAKRALAIGLQVLDERASAPGPSASPATPSPAPLATTHPAGDEPGTGG
jgi:CheY-like chemotaxis protein